MSLRYAVLIALHSGEGTGYEIAKWFDEGMGYFWQASHQQIYQELRKMAEHGLVTFNEVEQKGKPAKKIYRVTPAGLNDLKDWLLRPAKYSPVKDELLMKIYAGYMIPPDDLLAEVKRHQQDHRVLGETFRHIEQQWFARPDELPLQHQYIYLTLKNGIAYVDSWLNWCEEVIAFLQARIAQEQSCHGE